MSDKLEACADCSQTCRVIHQRNRDPSPIVTSFFKVMFGANYCDVLFLPPLFARSVPGLIDRETQLEDSSGERWTVTVSNVDGSLAFCKGWDAFSVDHRLKMGEMLVFHYINQSHFSVQIFGASGCPKYRHVKINGNLKKRTRTERDFVAHDGPSFMKDNELGSNGSMGSDTLGVRQHLAVSTHNTLDSKTRQYEELLCMIERNDGYIQGEYRSCLFDLSIYEISAGAEKSSDRGTTMPEFASERGVPNSDPVNLPGDVLGTSYIEKPGEKGKNGVTMPEEDAVTQKAREPITTHPRGDQDNATMKYAAEADLFDRDPVKLSRHVLETFSAKTAGRGKKSLQLPKVTHQNTDERSKPHRIETMKVTKKEPVVMRDMHIRDNMLCGNGGKGMKECSRTFRLPTKDDAAVKEEPLDFDDMPQLDDADASCLAVIGREHYLELPTNFPSVAARRSSVDRKVVLLRGADTRPWAVLYIHKFGIKALTDGWEWFCKANGFQPSDECLFQRERDKLDCIFRVSVVNRQFGSW